MRRYVRRGAKGIALIDIRSDLNRLRYVFDISDTGARENSRSVNLWQLRDEHFPAVSAMLETSYAIPANADFGAQLESVAAQLVREYWEENKRDILDTLANSFLEDYDEFNAGAAFRNAAQASVSYCLMSRCGLEPNDYLEREDFMSVFDFNTPDAAAALGTAVSGINQQVLREIGATIRRYEREKIAGRSITHGDDLHESRGLPGPNVRLSNQEMKPLGKYGQLRKAYLKEHRPILWNQLILKEALLSHLQEIDETAHRRLDEMLPQMAAQAGVTEELKQKDPLAWAGLMNSLKAQAEEIILNELVYN